MTVVHVVVAYLGVAPSDVLVERPFLVEYFEALVENGVSGYSFDHLQRDYQRALMFVLEIVTTSDVMNMGEGRGTALMDVWTERTFARLRSIDPDKLL